MIAAGPVAGTFDLAVLTMTSRTSSPHLFMLCVAGCCFWLAIAPLHSWMDQVLTRASVPAAIVAGVLAPAIGGYALFRLAGPLHPQAYQLLWAPLAMLGIASILYGGLCALAQQDLKRFVAFGTTSIGGFILLAFAIRTPVATTGAVILLVGQGLVVTLLLYSSELSAEGSGALAAVAWIGWLVVPVLLGQVLVLLGAFQAARNLGPAYGMAVAASVGLLLSGAGAARIHYRRLFPHP
jgi:NADH:ubiquinone oxidoreductase subunit 4 (subunit M)